VNAAASPNYSIRRALSSAPGRVAAAKRHFHMEWRAAIGALQVQLLRQLQLVHRLIIDCDLQLSSIGSRFALIGGLVAGH